MGLKGGNKGGFSEEYLDKLQDSDYTTTMSGGGDAASSSLADLSLGWERLRLSDGDLLRSSSTAAATASHRDVVDFEKQQLKVSSLVIGIVCVC
jgi:hypothetical protein